MQTDSAILAMDIGAGTQDILLYEPGRPMENCVQLILPSPTVVAARRVMRATHAGQRIFLTGNLMGGGPLVWAVRAHLNAGLAAFATPLAALTLHDDPEQITQLGLRIVAEPPDDVEPVSLRDVDLPTLSVALAPYGVELPRTVAVAVQDHGFSPRSSNRAFRFAHWRRFVEGGGDIHDLLYREPPSYLTRMQAVRRDAPGAYVMDTGAAAIWGALGDEEVARHRDEGLVIVNVGNAHAIAVLLQGSRVRGLFEQHTGSLTGEQLGALVERLRAGQVTNEEVFAAGGHGAYVAPGFDASNGYRFVAVTGPNRGLAAGLGYYLAAPYGDMMLAGCFGLVAAVRSFVEQSEDRE
ncbi:MAG: DUF1786 domain-containing protein [Chloroflexi bacterium]|nr:DUF1786 domain-containing protein [Chloroflexota bacterium]MCL5110011.1 DUF1786 domain-containing protein [Chloroflexota bacterium]